MCPCRNWIAWNRTSFIIFSGLFQLYRVPTAPGNPGKMTRAFPVMEKIKKTPGEMRIGVIIITLFLNMTTLISCGLRRFHSLDINQDIDSWEVFYHHLQYRWENPKSMPRPHLKIQIVPGNLQKHPGKNHGILSLWKSGNSGVIGTNNTLHIHVHME